MATTHGMTHSRLYRVWVGMTSRCKYPKHTAYARYGGKGIEVCERWKTFQSFMDDMYASYQEHAKIHGERNTTLDRVNGDGNYEPSNCRWATYEQQEANKKRNTPSGIVGITWDTKKQSWKVRTSQKHGRVFLGYRETLEEAIQTLEQYKQKEGIY